MTERCYRGRDVELVVDTETMGVRFMHSPTGRGWRLGGL